MFDDEAHLIEQLRDDPLFPPRDEVEADFREVEAYNRAPIFDVQVDEVLGRQSITEPDGHRVIRDTSTGQTWPDVGCDCRRCTSKRRF